MLYTSTHYPSNYGFIPRTLGDDGDPLDVLVLCSENIAPMTLVRCYPIGVMKMLDSGRGDEKIIAVPYSNQSRKAEKLQCLIIITWDISDNITYFAV